MGLNINTNIAAMNTSRSLEKSTSALETSLERLSSGLRINRAADDAAGLYIAEGFKAQATGSDVAQRNAQDGISMVQTAEGALVEVGNMLQRMRELAVQAANGTNTDTNRTELDKERAQLTSQIESIATQTNFNGIYMLNSAGTGYGNITLQIGAKNGETFTLTFSTDSIRINSGTIGTVSILASSLSTQATAQTAITTFDNAINAVSSMRSQLGAYQNRLDYTINNLAVQEENATSAESAIRDADIATETISFTRNQILVSAGTSMLAQANVLPQSALQLLQ